MNNDTHTHTHTHTLISFCKKEADAARQEALHNCKTLDDPQRRCRTCSGKRIKELRYRIARMEDIIQQLEQSV